MSYDFAMSKTNDQSYQTSKRNPSKCIYALWSVDNKDAFLHRWKNIAIQSDFTSLISQYKS